MKRSLALLALSALAVIPLRAQTYNVSFTNGGSWSTVYAQGFSTSLGATPTPGVANGSTVDLTQFQFFKSGTADSAANIQLAVFNTMYPNLTGLTESSSAFVGLSANTLASTAALNTGDAETFTFNNLALTYGNDYMVMFVNVGAGGALTPILVSALTCNYALQSDNNYHPTANYGTESQFQYATANYINGSYFSAFSYGGDALFNATLTATPEPGVMTLLGCGMAALAGRRLWRKR
jgi:hypothetical protein